MAVAAAAGLAGLVTPAAASAQTLQASLYLTPSTGSPHVGDELDVQVRLNSGSQPMGSVEAILTYPASQLSVVGFDTITSSWPTQGTAVSNGLIKVVGAAFTPVTGDANLTTIHFKVIGTGTAQICPADQSNLTDPAGSQDFRPAPMSGATFVAGSHSFEAGCIIHDEIAQGARHTITIHGDGFRSTGAGVAVSGTGVKTSGTAVVSATQLTTTIKVSTTAATGIRDVTVTSGGQTYTCQSCLAISLGPQVSSVTPATVSRGTSGQVLAVHGQNFDRHTTVKITGLTVTATTWVSAQEVDVTVDVPATTRTGFKKVSLYDPNSVAYGYYGRGSCSTCLSVS